MRPKKILAKVLAGSQNVRFGELVALAEAFGFVRVRSRRSHHMFHHPIADEMRNMQDRKGQAKSYQVRQLLDLADAYNLTIGEG